jgi:pSer/pThr/pTyr-binding forkhead associated (FHA) protein
MGRGERLNATYLVLEGRNYVGRAADRPVDIDLDGQEPVERVWTSRQHAVVTWDRGTLSVEDLNSLNGTFVNRARIHPGQRVNLQSGDVIQIGTVQMKVVLE